MTLAQVSIGSLRAHLAAFRSECAEGKEDIVSVLALGMQEAMVKGAIDSCRKNGVSEDDILAILGEDTNLATGETRVERVLKCQ